MASRNSDSANPSSKTTRNTQSRRLNDGVRQRVVGALVLVALAVIFLPSLLDREGARYIDITSQIPEPPDIQPIAIAEPEPVVDVAPAPPVNEVFQPEFKEQSGPAPDPDAPLAAAESDNLEPVTSGSDSKPSEATTRVQTETAEEPTSLPKPDAQQKAKKAEVSTAKETRLDAAGLPEGWVVQVAAYSKEASADRMRDKLLDAGFRAYTRAVETPKGRFVRVFVGPKLERADAESEKRRLDQLLKTETLVLRYKV
ncbi:SPOR domain-containing protein [Microbulbifer sp.]|uniref:SPOR domain-containing protein n=1 Tax=Microbulbifer sp. TaxID=1908541 RepID=UPI002584D3FD|nr:SPOR domain-containing protein [Microbulbifer sp.]